MAAYAQCPQCGSEMENVVPMHYLKPAEYDVEIGYCRHCSRRFEVRKDTGAYQSLTWAPLCRVCGEQIQLDMGRSDVEHRYYRCPKHEQQLWEYGPADEEWTWRGTEKGGA